MTGPDHYARAERLLDDAHKSDHAVATQFLAAAQVHATLAQAAATIDANRINPGGWMTALSADNE